MDLLLLLAFLALGVTAGVLGGLMGIGGGIIIIPVLVFIFGFSQHEAQGTSLTLMLPPIGILAAMEYARKGYIQWWPAVFICLGFFLGAFLGSMISVRLIHDETWMKRLFGALLLIVSVKMIFFPK